MTTPTAADVAHKREVYELNAMALGNLAAIWFATETHADEERQLRTLRRQAQKVIDSLSDFGRAAKSLQSATGGAEND